MSLAYRRAEEASSTQRKVGLHALPGTAVQRYGPHVRIAILGSGVVGQALARGLAKHGHEVRIGTRKDQVDDLPVGTPSEVVKDADLVFLSVLGTAAVDLVTSIQGELRGKVLIDTTNPLDFSTGSPGSSSDTATPSGSKSREPFPTHTW